MEDEGLIQTGEKEQRDFFEKHAIFKKNMQFFLRKNTQFFKANNCSQTKQKKTYGFTKKSLVFFSLVRTKPN